MVHFLSGAAYSGKTTALYGLARTLTAQGRRVLFLVPEQQTASTEADLVRLCENPTGDLIEVLNFQRLPNRIFREIGGLTLPAENRIRKLLTLQRILRRHAADFPYFSKQAKHPTFLTELAAFLEELERHGMTPAELRELSRSAPLGTEPLLAAKLDESACLAEHYEALFLAEHGDVPDEQSRLLAALAAEEGADFFAGKVVLLDGFYDFTARQYDLICHMARHADEVYLSSLEDESESDLFYRPRGARRYLQSRLDGADYEILSPEELGLSARKDPVPEDLAFLCDHIRKNPAHPFDRAPERLSLTLCRTPYEEVSHALRQVVTLHEQAGADWSDCAVLYRDTALYAPLIRALAAKYRVPLYTDEKTSLADSSLALLFLSAAEIAAGEERAEPFVSLLFSDLTPIGERCALLWERYIRTWSLEGEKLYTREDYTASVFGLTEMIHDSMRRENEETLALINREKHRLLAPLERLKSAVSTTESAREMTGALLAFAAEISAERAYGAQLDAARQAGEFSRAALQESLFSACLDTLDLLAEFSEPLTPKAYAEYLALAFSLTRVGALPSSPQALATGDVTFTRISKVRHLFLLGLNEDSFPRATPALPLLNLRERSLLSGAGEGPLFFARPASEVTLEEYFLFYLACAVPREHLHLSYCARSLSGAVLSPSVFVRRAKILFPHLEESSYDPSAALPLSTAELYDYLAAHAEDSDEFTEGARALLREHSSLPIPPDEATLGAARDHTRPEESGGVLTVSQAKLSTYQKCPYRYFLQYKLLLSEEHRAEFDVSLRGTIVHSALEHLLKPLSQGRAMLPALEGLTRESVAPEFLVQRSLLAELGFVPSALEDFFLSDLERSTGRLIETIREEFALGSFRPILFEADLSRNLKPVERLLASGTKMRISGKADRIDLALDRTSGTQFARVVDYKTGAHAFDATQVYNGFDTQLLLYLFTLSENGIPALTDNVRPAGAYYLRAHMPPATLNHADEKKRAAKDPLANAGFERSGIFLNEAASLSAMRAPGVETVTDCTPISYNKSLVPSAPGGLLASEEDFDVLREAVFDFAADTAERILRGDFPREPIWKDAEEIEGCRFCPYRAVCRYEKTSPCRSMKKADRHTFFDLIRKGGIHRG